ncbi:hypothetical protein EHS25_004564 [Saitozyma podzolica]|uniref:STAS domain-containing protein n=1 Tax=Saitozyma podzolica TaxID=1890683 RepID=A0A427YUE9_9TREE|nr:hypothetical protein EHS25_004564 [Saitozyma podzolica]
MSSNPASRALTPSSSKIDLFTLHRSMAPSRSGAGERAPLLTQNGEGSARRNYTMELDASGGTDTSNAGVSGVTGMSGVSGVSGGALGSEEGGKDTPRDRERGDDPLAKKRSSTAAVAKKIRQRSKYYVPVTEWLPNYSWSLFSGDVVAGISVACLLIPQAMSYANGLARLTPVAGLWSTAIPALIYGALGTCRRAALSLLIGQMIQEMVYADPHNLPKHPELEAAAIALVTTFQIGIITTALGLLRLGFLDVVLSRALLRGFITAVGIIIFIEQLVPMLGLAAVLSSPQASHDPPTTPIPKLLFIFEHLEHVNKTTAILSFSSLAVLIVARVIKQWAVQRPGGRWVRFVPEILIVVVGTTALTGVFKWNERGVDILGKISGGAGLPFGLPLDKRRMKYFNYTFPTAFVSAVVGIVDSVVAARENGSKYGYAVSPNRELVALGTANLGASLMAATGGIPVFGSITRSRLNGQTGGRTQMAAIITSITIILSIFFLLPYLYFLPKAVLAAIITLVVYAILAEAPHEFMFFWHMRAWTDFLQMTGTFILTLLFSIETGLVASVVFSLILVVQKSTQTRIKIIGRLPNTEEWVPIDEDEAAQEELPGVLVVRIRENLNFANTGQLKERLRRLELYGMQKSHPSDAPSRESAKAIILHMGDVDEIDASAIQILAELTRSYVERGVGLHFAHLRPTHSDVFRLVGITDLLGPSHFHRDLRDAMREIESLGYGNSVVSRYT